MAINSTFINNNARFWFLLAITSLAIAGLFSLPPVILRGPFFANMFDIEHIFATSLVIHVDLSVYVWMLAISCMFWALIGTRKYEFFYKINFFLALIGTLLIILSAFLPGSEPIKNNYIPVINNLLFFVGIAFFASGLLFQSILGLFNNFKLSPVNFGTFCSAVITIFAFISFYLSYIFIQDSQIENNHNFYEHIFWGGGHILQIVYTNFMLVTWLILYENITKKKPLPSFALNLLFLFNLITASFALLLYLPGSDINNIYSGFTQHMRIYGGVTPFILALAITGSLLVNRQNKAPHYIKAALILSIFLFGFGGLLAFMISGTNVTIPAHYHGSIVGISLSFMALIYYLLPKFNYKSVKDKLASWQLYIYGAGQLAHVSGLAWMGGYGALRKAPGTSQNIDNIAAKALFFSGGSLAILGGFLFIVFVGKCIFVKKDTA